MEGLYLSIVCFEKKAYYRWFYEHDQEAGAHGCWQPPDFFASTALKRQEGTMTDINKNWDDNIKAQEYEQMIEEKLKASAEEAALNIPDFDYEVEEGTV